VTPPTAVVLSFDVEEHHRIEAASALDVPSDLKREYAERMEWNTRQILDQLAAAGAVATFYVVGEIAETHPGLVRDIAAAGHEVGTHSWSHRRVHTFTPETFRDDLRRSIDALSAAAGTPVVGFRAPTFSVVCPTAWAADVLASVGLKYDTSVFPVRHDRYGVPGAPRVPFRLSRAPGSPEVLELPMATFRLAGHNLPVAGGGYFRLFPLELALAGIDQLTRAGAPLAMLYFHPWEFDPGLPRLPLGRVSAFRTYVGLDKTACRLDRLLAHYRGRFRRAIDVAESLDAANLPAYALTASPVVKGLGSGVGGYQPR
jgi:polysaccharide deacetylase family protein (PEP-CTERM system associated)